jgi:ketosteroid isomerase-like protein
MSRENVEIVRAAYDAFNRGDWDAAFRDMHPDFEFAMQHAPNPGPHRGRNDARARMEDGLAAYEAFSYELDDLRESGEQVVALIRVRVRPKGTTAEIENRVGHVWALRDGKVVSLHLFPKRDEALESAGLRG